MLLNNQKGPLAKKFELRLSKKAQFIFVPKSISLKFISEILNRENYLNHFFESDVILLPYDSVEYKARTSGIFIEAIYYGKIPLVKEGSWLARELEKFDLQELIINWESNELLDEVNQLVKCNLVKIKIQIMQNYYKEYYSFNNYLKTLRQIFLENNLLETSA